MPIEIRPLTEDELQLAWPLEQQAFHVPDDRRDYWLAWTRPSDLLGAFVDGELGAMTYIHRFGQFFGGRSVPMGGVGSVAVAPEHRGSGIAKRVMTRALEEMRDGGQLISALYPATTSLYRGLGYEVAGSVVWRQLSPRFMRDLRRPDGLATRRAREGDMPSIRRCYEQAAPRCNGWLDRDDHRWGALEAWWKLGQYLYVVENGDGGIEAFVAYRHEPTPPGAAGEYAIRVDDFVAATPGGLRAAWWILASSASVVDVVTVLAPPEDSLLLLLPEQRGAVRAEVGWMLRLVDAAGAVAARGYATGVDVSAPIELTDPLFEANAGRFRLRVSKGEGRLEPGGDGGIRLGIGAFSSLYTGWSDTATLALAGLLEDGTDAERASLDTAFAGPTPWLMDEF